MSLDQITPAALKLSVSERARLASFLWDSIEDPFLSKEGSDEEVIALALKRDAEIESGAVRPITHEELMKRLRR